MKTLSILKVFLRLKRQELKAAYFHIWFPILVSTFVISYLLEGTAWAGDWQGSFIGYMFLSAFCVLVVEAIIFLIGYAVYKFCKWIRSNWRKATKIVNEKDK